MNYSLSLREGVVATTISQRISYGTETDEATELESRKALGSITGNTPSIR